MTVRRLVILVSVCLAPVSWASATVSTVPTDFSTIQAAIDSAAPTGCTIQVSSGLYPENIDFLGKSITVESVDGAAVTIIDGSACTPGSDIQCSTVTFRNGEQRDSVLRGFTITGGKGYYYVAFGGDTNGGGILCDGASPSIVDCLIVENDCGPLGAGGAGGGLACNYGSHPLVVGCVFMGNTADYGGGIVADFGSSPVILRNVFDGNTALHGGGVKCNDVGYLTIQGCLFFGNDAIDSGAGFGAGIQVADVDEVLIDGCTIYDNYADFLGGGLHVGSVTNCTIRNTIFWDNSAGTAGPSIFMVATGSGQVSNSVLAIGGLGGPTSPLLTTGVIDLDPLFVTGLLGGEFYLSQIVAGQTVQSPCVDSGDPGVVPTGTTRSDGAPDTGPSDMGYHYPPYADFWFVRGDANSDGGFDISDPVFTLSALFVPGSAPSSCEDASDANDDGTVDISDSVYSLSALFVTGSPQPSLPYPACGIDPTPDMLDCAGPAPGCP